MQKLLTEGIQVGAGKLQRVRDERLAPVHWPSVIFDKRFQGKSVFSERAAVVAEENLAGTGQDLTITDARGVPFAGITFYRVLVY